MGITLEDSLKQTAARQKGGVLQQPTVANKPLPVSGLLGAGKPPMNQGSNPFAGVKYPGMSGPWDSPPIAGPSQPPALPPQSSPPMDLKSPLAGNAIAPRYQAMLDRGIRPEAVQSRMDAFYKNQGQPGGTPPMQGGASTNYNTGFDPNGTPAPDLRGQTLPPILDPSRMQNGAPTEPFNRAGRDMRKPLPRPGMVNGAPPEMPQVPPALQNGAPGEPIQGGVGGGIGDVASLWQRYLQNGQAGAGLGPLMARRRLEQFAQENMGGAGGLQPQNRIY